MFNKLKQFKELADQARNLKSALAEEKVEVENQGIRLVMDGNQKIISLTLPEHINKDELERLLPVVFNEAIAKVQRLIAAKMQAGNFNLPGF